MAAPLPGQVPPYIPPPVAGSVPASTGVIREGAVGEANPFLSEARPLLILLSNLRFATLQSGAVALMDQVAQTIANFEVKLRGAGLPEQQVTTAKYALCATADDIVQNLPASERNRWTQYSMLSRFFQTRTSGVGFYEELAKAKANPALNYNLLELMHACLSLGFEGQYRATGGELHLQQVRRDLYETLRYIKNRSGEEISPHWKGQEIPPSYVRRTVPVWAVAASAAAILLATFVALRFLLAGGSDALAARLIALNPEGKIVIDRGIIVPPAEPQPPRQSTQLERVKAALAPEITEQRVAVSTDGRDIVVRLPNDLLFDRGSANLRDGIDEALKSVAGMLNGEKDEIRVVGYTDSTPIRSSLKFKDNQDLSQKRAEAVLSRLAPDLQDASRLKASGRGDKEAVGDNKTDEGRALNRRVDIRIDWID